MDENTEQMIRWYVAGASLSFGFIILVQEGFSAYYARTGVGLETISGEILFALFTIIHLVGGFFGGYLVGRKRGENAARTGVTTALLAYIIEFVYNLIFFGSFGGNLLAVLGLVCGSVFGAMYASHESGR
jgi:hypothetical protein